MHKIKFKFAVFLTVILMTLITFSSCNMIFATNPIAGTYRERHLSITLNSNYSFTYYSGITNSTSKGTYSYTLSEDKKFAYVTLDVTSGSCSYDGATVYSIDNTTYLVPKIGPNEVLARTMIKV